MKITWNTDVNAPGCPGEIVAEDGRTLLIQTDWDYPGVASTFGWDMMDVQHWPEESELAKATFQPCQHESTVRTGACKECGMQAGDFISAAGAWLRENNGATCDDPGYFDND